MKRSVEETRPGVLPVSVAKLRLELVRDSAGTWTLIETSNTDGVIIATGPPHTHAMMASIISAGQRKAAEVPTGTGPGLIVPGGG